MTPDKVAGLDDTQWQLVTLASAILSPGTLLLDVQLIAAGRFSLQDRDAIKWLIHSLVSISSGGVMSTSDVNDHPFVKRALDRLAVQRPRTLDDVTDVLAHALAVNASYAARLLRRHAESGVQAEAHAQLRTLEAVEAD